MNKFDLKYQWKQYLNAAGLDEAKMPADQIRECKRAFVGAWGQLLLLQRDELSKFDENNAVIILQQMLTDVINFWNKEASRQN